MQLGQLSLAQSLWRILEKLENVSFHRLQVLLAALLCDMVSLLKKVNNNQYQKKKKKLLGGGYRGP